MMKKLDVVIFGSLTRPMGPAGTMRRILKNEEYFVSRGYEVTVISSDGIVDKYDDVQKLFSVPKVVPRKNFLTSIKRQIRQMVKSSFLLSSIFYLRDIKCSNEVVKQYLKYNREPDIVSFHSIDACYYFLKHNKRDVKVLIFFHSDAIPFKMISYNYPSLKGSWLNAKHVRKIEYCINRVDKCVFISQIGMNNFKKIYPHISNERISLVINGIEDYSNEEKLQLNTQVLSLTPQYRMCCVGTINGRKGQQLICEALSKINKSLLDNIHVSFIGDGSEKENLIKYCSDNGLDQHVSFLGTLSNTEIYKYLAQNSIYILMSYNEGLPISIIEAMRAGLPIISTNISGIPELIHTDGESCNGILLEPNVDQLVNVFCEMSDYDWEKMGKNSRMRFEADYTFEKMKIAYCNMVDSIFK